MISATFYDSVAYDKRHPELIWERDNVLPNLSIWNRIKRPVSTYRSQQPHPRSSYHTLGFASITQLIAMPNDFAPQSSSAGKETQPELGETPLASRILPSTFYDSVISESSKRRIVDPS